MKIVFMVVVHFTYYGHAVGVMPQQSKGVFTTQAACTKAISAEKAYWNTITAVTPDSIGCLKQTVRN